jgi:hypothetical protein
MAAQRSAISSARAKIGSLYDFARRAYCVELRQRRMVEP